VRTEASSRRCCRGAAVGLRAGVRAPCAVRAGAVSRWLAAVRAGGFSLSDLVVSALQGDLG
jgi:hypothetical protein